MNYELVKDKISTLGVLDYWCNLKKIFHFLFFLRYFWKKKIFREIVHFGKNSNTINIMKQQILLILSSSKLFTRLMHNGAKNRKNSAIMNCCISEIVPFETIVLFQQSSIFPFFAPLCINRLKSLFGGNIKRICSFMILFVVIFSLLYFFVF